MDELGEIVVHARYPAGSPSDMLDYNLAHSAHACMLAAIDRYFVMHATEPALSVEKKIEADSDDVSPHKAAFEPHPDIVVNFLIIHDHRGTQFFVAQGIDRRVHEGGIHRFHHEADFLQ